MRRPVEGGGWAGTVPCLPHAPFTLLPMKSSLLVSKDNVSSILSRALDAGGGLLRLTPTWVPRSFLHPGKRIKLAPTDWYAFGAHRGGIDERWFGSTT
jgi:hypothetical protein